MKLKNLLILVVLALLTVSCTQGVKEKKSLNDVREKASYAMGWNIAQNLDRQYLDPDLAALYTGMKDALTKAESLVPADSMQAIIMKYQQMAMAKMQEARTKEASKHKEEGEKYLAENLKKDGVKELENVKLEDNQPEFKSKIQYRVIEEGNGKSPVSTDSVKVHYTGRLIDGTEFDSSVNGDPIEFPVMGVIPGWRQALVKMKEGDKWEVVIPSELAYGERGTPGGPIPGNATLVFEISLLEVIKVPVKK